MVTSSLVMLALIEHNKLVFGDSSGDSKTLLAGLAAKPTSTVLVDYLLFIRL